MQRTTCRSFHDLHGALTNGIEQAQGLYLKNLLKVNGAVDRLKQAAADCPRKATQPATTTQPGKTTTTTPTRMTPTTTTAPATGNKHLVPDPAYLLFLGSLDNCGQGVGMVWKKVPNATGYILQWKTNGVLQNAGKSVYAPSSFDATTKEYLDGPQQVPFLDLYWSHYVHSSSMTRTNSLFVGLGTAGPKDMEKCNVIYQQTVKPPMSPVWVGDATADGVYSDPQAWAVVP
jgi:hypothetical protein